MRKQLLSAALIFASMASISGCSGGGGGGNNGGGGNTMPAITSQPASQTVNQGQVATFNGGATGTPQPSIQWRKDGATIVGANSTSYTTPTTTASDNGSKFDFVASNAVGSVISAAATLTVNPVPPPTVTIVSPSDGSSVSGTIAVSASVSNCASVAFVQFNLDGTALGTVTATPYSVQWDTKTVANGSHALIATLNCKGGITPQGAGTTVSSQPVNVSVNNLPLTLTVSETFATVLLGSGHSFTATPSDPTATVSLSLSGPGSLSALNGNAFTYSVKPDVPTSFSATVTVTATLGSQTATATARITLNYPPVVLNGALPQNSFLVREGIVGITFFGSGLYPGCTYQYDASGSAAALTPNSGFSQFDGTALAFGSSNFDAKGHAIIVDCTGNGNGAGKSNVFGFSFIGNKNTVVLSATRAYHLRQGAGLVDEYDLVTMTLIRSINVGRLVYAIAVGDGYLYTTQVNGVALYVVGNPTSFPTIQSISLPMGVDEKGGWLCPTQDQSNLLTCVDITQANPTITTASVGTTPMEVKMTTTASGQLQAIVLNAGDGMLAAPSVPLPAQGQVIPSVRLPGMTVGHGEQTGVNGGTYLNVLEYASTTPAAQVRIAAPVSRFDRLVWFVDVSNPSQSMPISGQFSLQGDPYRLAVDTANRAFVIAVLDYAADGSVFTRFVRIDPATGAQTKLNSTAPFVSPGLAVNPLTGKIITCPFNGPCVQVPNN